MWKNMGVSKVSVIYIYIYRYGTTVNWDNVVFNTPKIKKASD